MDRGTPPGAAYSIVLAVAPGHERAPAGTARGPVDWTAPRAGTAARDGRSATASTAATRFARGERRARTGSLLYRDSRRFGRIRRRAAVLTAGQAPWLDSIGERTRRPE